MTEAKPKATIHITDGRGGLIELIDYRFKPAALGDIELDVAADQSDSWPAYLDAEVRRRGWPSGAIVQLEANRVGGSMTIQSPADRQVVVVWKRQRGGAMKVRARALASPQQRSALIEELLTTVTERCSRGEIGKYHYAQVLRYWGYPWRGELWLDDGLRLSQPLLEDRSALNGPRIIRVDWLLPGIDRIHGATGLPAATRELSAFLSVMLGCRVDVARDGEREWIMRQAADGSWVSTIETVGFVDPRPLGEMPVPGELSPTKLTAIQRPSFGNPRTGEETVRLVPADIVDLWATLATLDQSRRQQFRRAANLWHAALSLLPTYETTAFSLMVASCEALKPNGARFRNRSAYHVIEALFGKEKANSLQDGPITMLDVRDRHLHLGDLFGREFQRVPDLADPTFLSLSDELYWVTQAAIIVWLTNGGNAAVSPQVRQLTLGAKVFRWLRGSVRSSN